MAWEYERFPRYVSVGERRAMARRSLAALRKKGKVIEPVSIEGRTIARTFWGKGWCDHLESFSDFSNRLPRGRTYVRNGSVCHLAITPGRLEALVSGRRLYTVNVRIGKLGRKEWEAVKGRCAGQIGSMLELLRGRLSERVMTVVTDRRAGLFPQPGQIKLACSCPDWATMCKHVAAVLYGVGSMLDQRPELLFTLRGVDPQELITADLALPDAKNAAPTTLADKQLGEIFDIDLDNGAGPPARAHKAPSAAKRRRRAGAEAAAPHPGRRQARKKTNAGETDGRLPKIRPTGRSVGRLRRQLGLSASVFARALGVSAATVYRWESTTGRLRLRRRSLHALASLRQGAEQG